MNLVLNASEALGERNGTITISTGALHCDRAYLDNAYLKENLKEGTYVCLEIADTGEGMPPEITAKIFDPFFTTKFTGRGLGLAAVLGIVRGHHGAILVTSDPGKGTSFKALFPASDKKPDCQRGNALPESAWSGKGLILLVDDEQVLLAVAGKMLHRLGFTVLTAVNGCEALGLYRKYADEIRCVILDLTMPQMNGEECFRELRRIRENVKVLLSSGFNEPDATQHFVGMGLAGFIQKPYRFAELSAKLREILGE
jgi:CheY-like chemotaxis protein